MLKFWQAFVDTAAQVDEVLRSFDSHSREALIARFRELDRQQLVLNRARIPPLLSERRPNNTWVQADSAEAAILRREGAKKRRLKPLRQLLSEMPRLITDVTPCLMMSPLSVATLTDPHVFKFDLVIFDEASQVAPEEAAGAIVRGAQVIIGGDAKQLPPTRFFSVIGSDDADATAEEDGRVFESILDESSGLNLPQKMLRWHYRSRDEELIAFSNRHFYADRLFTFPNVQQDGRDLGVEFVHVPEGVYRRGRHLRRGLASLLAQLDPAFTDELARTVAGVLLTHPLVSTATGRLGTVVHREEFTKLLLALAGDTGITDYEPIINAPAEFDGLGARLKQHGLVMPSLYHNHDAELRLGAREFQHMLTATDPVNVKFCHDAHWVFRGCGDSQVALFDALEHHGSRIVELHLRQSRGGVWTEVFTGDGDIDYARLGSWLKARGLKPQLTLEQAVETGSPRTLEAVAAHPESLANTHRLFDWLS